MKILDYPENRAILLHYVRSQGKLRGAGDALNCTDASIHDYLSSNPDLKARVVAAKTQHEHGAHDDLQRAWNRNADVYNASLTDIFFATLQDGEVHVETTEFMTVKRDREGNVILDEHGEPVLELEKKLVKSYRKPASKWMLQTAISLMNQSFDKPELVKAAPQVLSAFLQYVKGKVDLAADGNPNKALLEAALEFEDVLKKQATILKGKKM